MEHSDINEINYIEKQPIWEPYLRNDILSLAACTLKYIRYNEKYLSSVDAK